MGAASFSQDTERKSGCVQMCLCRVEEAIRRCHERECVCVQGWGRSTKLSFPQYTDRESERWSVCMGGGDGKARQEKAWRTGRLPAWGVVIGRVKQH